MAGVFRTYDIRGKYPSEINDELAYKIGRSIAFYLAPGTVALGHDHRVSSPAIMSSLIQGLNDQGVNVINIGFCSSPELYHFNVEQGIIGIMITASHNPKEYNGIKINNYDGRMINYVGGINEIEDLVHKNDFPESESKGTTQKTNFSGDYVSYLKTHIQTPNRPIKVVVDTGNGVGGPIVEKLFKGQKNLEIIPLYFEPDGTYPNHQANPAELDTLDELRKTVMETEADFGAAFDGDADRCILVDERGIPISPDMWFCVIAQNENKENPGGTYYFDLWFSKVAKEYLKELNCNYVVLPLGVANYRDKLLGDGGIVASEISGHIMYEENLSQDDGFFALVKAINYYGSTNKNMSAMIVPFLSYFQDSFNVDIKNSDDVLKNVKSTYKDGNQMELDGVSVEYPEYWFNIRKSNTEPLVRVRLEANTSELLEEKKKELREFMSQF